MHFFFSDLSFATNMYPQVLCNWEDCRVKIPYSPQLKYMKHLHHIHISNCNLLLKVITVILIALCLAHIIGIKRTERIWKRRS